MPLPSQLVGPAQAPSLMPTLTLAHTPSTPLPLRAAVHAWHAPLQAESQQTPSAHCPVAQSPAPVQDAPIDFLQVPLPSQPVAPAHAPSGIPTPTLPQMPSAPEPFRAAEHAWHAPPHAESQQTPSVHCPVAQSPAPVQPRPKALLHVPPPSQACASLQPPLAWPTAT